MSTDLLEVYKSLYSSLGDALLLIDNKSYHDDDVLSCLNDSLSVWCEFLDNQIKKNER